MQSASDPAEAGSATPPEDPPTTERQQAWGKGFLAVSGTFVLPGLGHVFAGRRRRACFWFLVVVALQFSTMLLLANTALFVVALAMVPLVLLLAICAHVDAFLCGRCSAEPMLGRAWLRYALAIGILLGSAFFHPWGWVSYCLADYVRGDYVESFALTGGSMSPTLSPGDRFLAHKRAPWGRWSVVVVEHPQLESSSLAVRVVGLPGEAIEIIAGEVHVNGRILKRPSGAGPYLSIAYVGRSNSSLSGRPGIGCEGNPIQLRDNEYYVLGDNSALALDARLWEVPIAQHQLGALPAEYVKGRVTAIYWPPNRWRLFD